MKYSQLTIYTLRLILLIFFIQYSLLSFSQTVSISLSSVSACKGDTIRIPVRVKNFTSICAIGVRVSYDTTKLKYVNCIKIHSSLVGADFAKVRNLVTLGWFSVKDGIVSNIPDDGTLFEIEYVYVVPSRTEIKFVESASVVTDCNLKKHKMSFNPCEINPALKCK